MDSGRAARRRAQRRRARARKARESPEEPEYGMVGGVRVPCLTGSDNFEEWYKQMKKGLQALGLWHLCDPDVPDITDADALAECKRRIQATGGDLRKDDIWKAVNGDADPQDGIEEAPECLRAAMAETARNPQPVRPETKIESGPAKVINIPFSLVQQSPYFGANRGRRWNALYRAVQELESL